MSKSTIKKLQKVQETQEQKVQRVGKEIEKILLLNDLTAEIVPNYTLNIVPVKK